LDQSLGRARGQKYWAEVAELASVFLAIRHDEQDEKAQPEFFGILMIDSTHYWLKNARVPAALMLTGKQSKGKQWSSSDEFLQVDIEIIGSTIATIAAAGTLTSDQQDSIELNQGLVWPCFADLHTHLDKGHTWNRSPNPDGTFASALATIKQDAATHWNPEDLYRRMEFGLKCSYAHGTSALRTHLDSFGDQGKLTFEVFNTLRDAWRDRLTLQAVALVSLDYFLKPQGEGEALADLVAESGGILGGVAYKHPDIAAQIDRVFVLAKDRNLDLDLHVDETDDADSICLDLIAQATVRHHYQGRVVCGHCCSLAVQDPEVAMATIQNVQQAGIGIVSLPMCNLYLQDRVPQRTPRWRGVTLLHELKQHGVPVAIASDNCRDPFHGYGDHDALEVFNFSVKIAHLDRPVGDWCRAITTTPADLMGLPTMGRIGVGLPADLILFRGRSYSELLSRSQSDRIVLRHGKVIDTDLPSYAELDDLVPQS
jgi:cytosine/creatinine deaminase